MRKFAVAQAFLYYLENYRKNPVASFRLTTRNRKLLFYFVRCRFFAQLNMETQR